jgi:hypothetical protein
MYVAVYAYNALSFLFEFAVVRQRRSRSSLREPLAPVRPINNDVGHKTVTFADSKPIPIVCARAPKYIMCKGTSYSRNGVSCRRMGERAAIIVADEQADSWKPCSF